MSDVKPIEQTIDILDPFYDILSCKARYIDVIGGRGSGKSFNIARVKALQHVSESNRKTLYVRKYQTTLKLSVIPEILGQLKSIGLKKDKHFTYNKSENRIIIAGNKNEIWFTGMDDPEKTKSIKDITDIVCEEATELNEQDFDALDMLLRNEKHHINQMILIHNPIPIRSGSAHWLQRRLLRKVNYVNSKLCQSEDVAVLKTTYLDNLKYLPAVYIKKLEEYKETNPDLYKLWALGDFIELKGAIYKNWDIVDEVPKNIDFLGYGLDFGFSVDPSALVAIWKKNNEVWVKEVIYMPELTNQAVAILMKAYGIQSNDEIIADSSEPKSIKEIKDEGFLIHGIEKTPNYKVSAVRYIQGLKIHLVKPCSNILKEIESYMWKKDKDGNVLPVLPDGNDHALDAMLYRLYTKEKHFNIRVV